MNETQHKELCDKLDLIAVLLQTMVDMIRNAQDVDEGTAAADIHTVVQFFPPGVLPDFGETPRRDPPSEN